MRIEQLYYFKEVALNKSITAAAERLFISQQTLSDAIAKLETEFNLQLFERKKKGVLLTKMGEAFYRDAMKIIATYEQMRLLHQSTIQPTAPLSMVCDRHFNNSFFNSMVTIYQKYLPHTPLQITEALWAVPIVEQVLAEQAHIGIVTINQQLLTLHPLFLTHLNVDLLHYSLLDDQLYALMNKACPLADKKSVSFEDLLNYPLVLDHDPNLLSLLESSAEDTPLNIFMLTSSQRVQTLSIQKNLAIGLTNGLSLKYGYFDYLDVIYRPIERAELKMTAFIRRENAENPVITDFFNLFTQYLNHKLIL